MHEKTSLASHEWNKNTFPKKKKGKYTKIAKPKLNLWKYTLQDCLETHCCAPIQIKGHINLSGLYSPWDD